MVNDLLSIVHNLLYSLKVLEFTEEERDYIVSVIMKTIILIEVELNKNR